MAKGKDGGANAPTPEMTARVFELLEANPGVKTSDLTGMLDASQLQVRAALMAFEEAGKVRRTGQTRGTRWYVRDGASFEPLPPEAGEERSSRKKAAAAPSRARPKAAVLDAHLDLLGTVPDSDVSEKTGVSVRTIAAYRKQHGIAGYSGPRKRAGEAPVAKPVAKAPAKPVKEAPAAKPARAGSKNAAWRIDVRVGKDTISRFALAPSLTDAAQIATDAAVGLGGEVVGLAWAGEALS